MAVTSINQSSRKIRKADAAGIEAAVDLLLAGQLVAFPTETVYGLGANAYNDLAIAQIFAAKARPQFNPLIVHVGSVDEALKLGIFNDTARLLADSFWPGPLTLIVPRAPDCPISHAVSAGLDTLALRVPAHKTAQALLTAAAMPIAAPSANRSGHVSATTAQHVIDDLGENLGLVLDGGPVNIGLESTIISCVEDHSHLLRPGAVARETIAATLGRPIETAKSSPDRPQAPGQLASHYAPRANLRLEVSKPRSGEALLAFGPHAPQNVDLCLNLSPSGDLTEAAAHLFAYLRDLDRTADAIAVMPIPNRGLGEAINDRLRRAAHPRP